MDKKYSSVHYIDYLGLDKILDAQHLRSIEMGQPAHDEMLFIIIHQVYELWFKQIIHELDSIVNMFSNEIVHEKSIGIAFSRLNRVTEIQQILIDQIRVLETMTSLDFLDFRNLLVPASGFQSFQFRLVEIKLGLKPEKRLTYNNQAYSVVFNQDQQAMLDNAEKSDSLFDLIEKWLERMPFINNDTFKFVDLYKDSVTNMIEREKQAILSTEYISDADKKLRISMLEQSNDYIMNAINPEAHEKLRQEGVIRMSYNATIAALMIYLYRDEPILRNPFNFLNKIADVDEMFTNWRYRHAQMVMRLLGRKMGTGGSSGHAYLAATAEKHQIFGDLNNISTLLIPRSELPELPSELAEKLNFAYYV